MLLRNYSAPFDKRLSYIMETIKIICVWIVCFIILSCFVGALVGNFFLIMAYVITGIVVLFPISIFALIGFAFYKLLNRPQKHDTK